MSEKLPDTDAAPHVPELAPALVLPRQPEHGHVSRWRRVVAAGMSTVLLVAGDTKIVQAEPTVEHLSPEPVATAYSTLVPAQGLKECPAVPQEDLELAKNLMEQPLSYRNLAIQMIYDEQGKDVSLATSYLDNQQANYHLYEASARDNGLTVHNPIPFMKPLIKDLAENPDSPRLPFAVYLAEANAFLNLYGIQMDVDTGSPDNDNKLYPPMAADLETSTAKWDMYSLMEGFAALPEEYIHLIGLENIQLVGGKNAGIVADAFMDDKHDTMQFNIDTDFQPDVVYHEGNHEEDAALCGGPDASANDPAYTQYNGVNKYGAEATSHEGLRRSNQTSVDYSAETVKSLCEEKQTLDRRDNGVAFFDDYASVDPAEDKADTGSRIESPYGLGQITPADMPPRVVDKYATLLGRLAQADPRLAKYFMGIQSSGGTNAIAACAALKKDPSDGSKFIYSLFK